MEFARRDLPTREERVQDVSRRLRRVCREMPEAEFQGLVARIVDVEFRYRYGEEMPIESENR